MTARISENTKNAHTRSYMSGVCVFFVLAILCIFPHSAHAEYIESFISDIQVKKDSTFVVTEHIEYVFTEEKHGIFRCIPTMHPEEATSILKERYVDIVITSVRMDSADVPYGIDTTSTEICITVGDPNIQVHGTHTYEISYTVEGAVSYEEYGGADLYWNVSGTKWDVPIKLIEARVSSPDSVLAGEHACYRGREGETESCEVITEENGIIHFRGRLFNPEEGLTIAQALNRSLIANDVRERFKTILVWIAVLGVSLAGFLISLYRYRTKYKVDRPIIPQYEPYPGIKPMYAGFLFDKRLDARDITAGIVYLAEQGFFKIRKVDRKAFFFFEVDDYEMELLRPITEATDVFEKKLIELVFHTDSRMGEKITLHELKGCTEEVRENALIIQDITKRLDQDLKDQGFFVGLDFNSLSSTKSILALIILGVSFLFISSTIIILIIATLVIGTGIFTIGRRTKHGYEALNHLNGFKDFLRVTDTQRYIFHNAPEKNAEQFIEYLPYAVAFGVEKEWAKTFEGITIPNPGWYDGGTNMQGFSAISLTRSLGGFSTAFAHSAGGGVSSGGGHSGGGSGGGGGDSW